MGRGKITLQVAQTFLSVRIHVGVRSRICRFWLRRRGRL